MRLHAVSVRRGDKWVLRQVSWQLEPGERWALIGDNGAGKTQLLKLLSGDVWPTPSAGTVSNARSYRVARRPVDLIEAKGRVAYVGAEQQDKYARYGWNLAVRDVIATGLHGTDLLLLPVTAPQARRVAATLRTSGLQRLASRTFLSLSYGQKRLVLLARALVQNPDWLLLDELYNGLDADYRQRIDAVLASAAGRGQAWIATAHRAADVPRRTRRLLELAAGRVRAVRRLRAADLQRLSKRAAEQPAAARRARRGRTAASAPALLTLARVDLYVEYRAVLRALDWQLRRGEHWAVFGANGAGKSSFLKLLYGDLSPAVGGRIERRGFPRGTPIADWKRRVGYVSPELQTDYAADVTLEDLVISGRYASMGLAQCATDEDRRAAATWLRFFGLRSLAKRRPRELSYGQLRRALLARALTADAHILLLDEPFTGLDPAQRAIMKRLLERLMPRLTLIVAVHHAEDLPRGMTHALRLHNRRAYVTDFHSAT
jgi:molybdate transport system ATP-binding protein